MAPKIRVEGNRVYLDDDAFIITPGKAGSFSVTNEFGDKLGKFTVEGKTITPEDYGLADAPPLVSIARAWVAGNAAEKPAAPTSKGICQVTSSAGASESDLQAARAHRAWLKKQPGMRAIYLARDPASGKALTIAIWQSKSHLDAANAASGREGTPLPSTGVELFPFVEEP
jgi:hypothetical protein